MPSRFGVVLILIFWLAVTAHMIDREVLPRLNRDTPAVQIDIADEATRSVPGRWGIFRGDQRLGTLHTRMEPIDADGTFAFTSDYNTIQFTQGRVTLGAKNLVLKTIVHRDGRLAGQNMAGKLAVNLGGIHIDGKVNIDATVVNGSLVGRCVVSSSVIELDEPLPSRPVPPGPVLNPLQPMNRLRNVRPGQRWTILEVNPLSESMAILTRQVLAKYGGKSFNFGSGSEPTEYVAEVQSEPVIVERRTGSVPCWRIDYRGKDATASTWVAVSDGKVLRQQAESFGEVLRLERED